MDELANELNAALSRVATLERMIAELLLKNEQLRQKASSIASLSREHNVSFALRAE